MNDGMDLIASNRTIQAIKDGDTELERLLSYYHNKVLDLALKPSDARNEVLRKEHTLEELRHVIAWMINASPTDDAWRIWDEYTDSSDTYFLHERLGNPVMDMDDLGKKWGWKR